VSNRPELYRGPDGRWHTLISVTLIDADGQLRHVPARDFISPDVWGADDPEHWQSPAVTGKAITDTWEDILTRGARGASDIP
jgi:hypothetical protein